MSSINNKKKVKIECKRDLDFVWIVKDSKPKEEINEENLDTKIVYFCKDCQELVDFKKIKGKIMCKKCWSKKVAHWFEASIKNYYKI